jgi:hypothetical protein
MAMGKDQHKVTGGCLCGAIRYQSDQPPFQTGYCHCRMCQKGVGNIFGTAAFFRHADFRFETPEPRWYASSEVVRRGFCARCGSPIGYQHRDTEHIAIWMGTLDHPETYEPEVHWYSDSRIPWVDIHAELPDATESLASFSGHSSGEEKT